MIRKIIKIDAKKCNGCGICVDACHEGAIGLINGKACLLREDYCDGLGDCLPACPTGAITFEQRQALAYDEQEVKKNLEKKKEQLQSMRCPGSMAKELKKINTVSVTNEEINSQLNQWPVQIKLAPIHASYFQDAHLLIAADCTAYAYGSFHEKFMKRKITLIGCPKLDEGSYAPKLTELLKNNEIKTVTVIRMEVPCCGGIVNAVKEALSACGKVIPWSIVTISTEGEIIHSM